MKLQILITGGTKISRLVLKSIIKSVISDVEVFDLDISEYALKKFNPHIIFYYLDSFNNPNLDVIYKIRSNEPYVKIIAVIPHNAPREYVKHVLNAGAVGYVTKPFRIRDLQAILNSLLRRFQE